MVSGLLYGVWAGEYGVWAGVRACVWSLGWCMVSRLVNMGSGLVSVLVYGVWAGVWCMGW